MKASSGAVSLLLNIITLLLQLTLTLASYPANLQSDAYSYKITYFQNVCLGAFHKLALKSSVPPHVWL